MASRGLGGRSRGNSGYTTDDDLYGAEDKETGASRRKPVGGSNERMEGYPVEMRNLRPPQNEEDPFLDRHYNPFGEETPRYQLVDQPPGDGVRVLSSPGQLRGKAQRPKPF